MTISKKVAKVHVVTLIGYHSGVAIIHLWNAHVVMTTNRCGVKGTQH